MLFSEDTSNSAILLMCPAKLPAKGWQNSAHWHFLCIFWVPVPVHLQQHWVVAYKNFSLVGKMAEYFSLICVSFFSTAKYILTGLIIFHTCDSNTSQCLGRRRCWINIYQMNNQWRDDSCLSYFWNRIVLLFLLS